MEQLNFRFDSTSYSKAELALLSPEDIYSNADENLLMQLREDRRLERKPAGIHNAELGEYICMWANTVHGGLLVIGQEDSGDFSGCLKLVQLALNNLEKASNWHCPEAFVNHRRVPVKLRNGDLDFILLIYVQYHDTRVVRDIRQNVFVRVADTKKELKHPEEIRALEIAKGQVDLEQEPVSLAFPEEFNMVLVRQYVDGVKKIKKLAFDHSDEEVLFHGRLGKLKGQEFTPNVACALLFAKDPLTLFPGCKFRLQRYDGEVEHTGKNYNVVKNFFIEGAIPQIIVEVARNLKAQLREFTRLGSDGRFYTAPEYPDDAWYEAIVNAAVHRSYLLKNMVTFVKMFDDRLVIESPGGFPPPVTPETIYFTHSPRNPHLMQALFFMDFVKLSNEGTRRIRDTMSAMSLPRPEFAQKEVAAGFDSVRVTLRNNIKLRKVWVDAEVSERLGSLSGLTPIEIRILNYVAEHGSINVTQAQELTPGNKRWHTTKKQLDKMVSKEFLVHKHSPTIVRDSRAVYKLPGSDIAEVLDV